MILSLVGKNKVEIIDSRDPKFHFDESLHEKWERVNPVVFSWVMNSVGNGLLSSIICTFNAIAYG